MKIHRVIVGSLQTNCYIVASEKKRAFVIDPGDDAAKITQCLKKNGLTPVFIVNTHGHIDHIKANASLKLPVFAHAADAEMISNPNKNNMTFFFGGFDPVMPERLLKEGDAVELDELSFRVIHTPGHTRGGMCLLGQGVLFSGDTLFRDGIGRTDFPGASEAAMQDSLKILSKLDGATVVYPGHGPDTTIARELQGP